MSRLFDPSVMEPSPEDIAKGIKRTFVQLMNQVQNTQQQIANALRQHGRANIEPYISNLEQDYKALDDFVKHFIPEWKMALPVIQQQTETVVHPEKLEETNRAGKTQMQVDHA